MAYVNQTEIDYFVQQAQVKIAALGLTIAEGTLSGNEATDEIQLSYELQSLIKSLLDDRVDWEERDVLRFIHYYNDRAEIIDPPFASSPKLVMHVIWPCVSESPGSGSGDMILADAQTNTGVKTFWDSTLRLLNVAKTFDVGFTNTVTANRTYTLPDREGEVALTSGLDKIGFDLTAGASVAQGELAWNADEETLDLGLNGAVLQLGQEMHYHVKNTTGVQIDDGTAVMAIGTIGGSGRILIGKMDGSSIANAKFFLGIATEDIADGTDGKVTSWGKVRGINTDSWNEGDVLWVDNAVLGGLTNIQPTSGSRLPIAFVITKSINNGTIAVRATDGTYFAESHDTVFTSLTTDDIIKWDGTNWVNNNISAHTHSSSQISIPLGFGSPTVDQLQEYINNTGSSGFFTGGEISDGGAGTVNVAAGSGFIRTTNDENAELQSFKWSSISGLAITDNTTRYIYVDDSGTITASSDEFLEAPDKILLGVTTDEGGSIIHSFPLGVRLEESIGQMGRYIRRVEGINRDRRKGGLILGQSGDANRDLTMTAGSLWWGRTEYVMSAIDTSTADTFFTYSSAGQEDAVASQWPNTQYDNVGTLTTMTPNRWANLFFFLEPDGHIVMIYGRAQFTGQALAENEGVPSSSLPSRVSDSSILIARFTFQESSNIATISSAFEELFANAGVTDHGDLAGLSDNDHPQYSLTPWEREVTSVLNYPATGAANFNAVNGLANPVDITGQDTAEIFDFITLDILDTGRTSSGAANFLRFQNDGTDVFKVDGDGLPTMAAYGGGSVTGTATYALAVDTNGDVIEVALGGGSGWSLTATTILNYPATGAASFNAVNGLTIPVDITGQTGTQTFDFLTLDVLDTARSSTGDANFLRVQNDGTDVFRVGIDGTIIAKSGSASIPSIIFGSTNSGFFQQFSSNVIGVSINGNEQFVYANNIYRASEANGGAILNEASTATNPTLIHNRASVTTGLGGISGEASIITGGIEALNVDASQNVSIQAGNLNVQAGNLNVTEGIFTLSNEWVTTAVINNAWTIEALSTGSVAAGFGAALTWDLENGSDISAVRGRYGMYLSNPTNGVEDSVHIFTASIAGSVDTVAEMSGEGLRLKEANQIIQTVHLQLSQAQIKALNTTPIALVAAPGAGKYIQMLSGSAFLDHNGTSYTTAANLILEYEDGSDLGICSGLVAQASDLADRFVDSGNYLTINSGVQLKGSADSTDNGGTIDVYFQYVIINTN